MHTKDISAHSYAAFLARKSQLTDSGGFEPIIMPDHLFDFQKAIVDWAVRIGRGGIFADCGLGKTPMELAWAENVHRKTGKPVLLLTPLSVGFQIVEEADKFGHDAALSRDGQVTAPITVTNYEQLNKFDWSDFGGVVCDESSAIKSFDGTRRAEVTEFMRRTQYRLLGTATAAPNDYIELGTSSEALGALGHMDMLSRFFVNDNRSVSSRGRTSGGKAVDWRLKGHAEGPFWQWVSTWARAMRRPSDFGFSDEGFELPSLTERVTVVESREPRPDTLFDMPAVGLQEEREETRRTLVERCESAAELIEPHDLSIAWCNLNDEGDLLERLIPNAIQVAGSDADTYKDKAAQWFVGKRCICDDAEFRSRLARWDESRNVSGGCGCGHVSGVRRLVTKAKIYGYGLNFQHCAHMTYFPSHSYEQYYQAQRRMWRFGQDRPVVVDIVTTEGGKNVLSNLRRKARQADVMFTELVSHMNEARAVAPHIYDKELELPSWI